MNTGELDCPQCRRHNCIAGFLVNDDAILWCLRCKTYTEGPADKIVQQWLNLEKVYTTYGKLINSQEKRSD